MHYGIYESINTCIENAKQEDRCLPNKKRSKWIIAKAFEFGFRAIIFMEKTSRKQRKMVENTRKSVELIMENRDA